MSVAERTVTAVRGWRAPQRRFPRIPGILGGLVLSVLVVMVWAAATGPVSVSLVRAGEIIGHAVAEAIGWGAGGPTTADAAVLLQIRAPRVVVGALVGAALAISGVAMQGVFRNPLAEPGVIGVSAGAALGAVTALYFGFPAFSRWLVPGMAFLGAAVAVAAVFTVTKLTRHRVASTMLLIGIAVNALLGSVISIMLATAPTEEDLRSITFWLQGGLDARTWSHVGLVVVPILVGCSLLLCFARDLNVMVLGDDQGTASGVDVARSRMVILLLAALVTGVAVSVSGTIAFVGMVVPHALRLVLGPDHRILIPASALGGAAFLVLADMVARTAFGPIAMQVGVITSIIGAPVLLAFVIGSRRGAQ